MSPLNLSKSAVHVHNLASPAQLHLTLSQTTNFRLFQAERLCRRQFKFDEDGRKFSKLVEKGEIACLEQFLLFPQCFQKNCTFRHVKPGLVWERVMSV